MSVSMVTRLCIVISLTSNKNRTFESTTDDVQLNEAGENISLFTSQSNIVIFSILYIANQTATLVF